MKFVRVTKDGKEAFSKDYEVIVKSKLSSGDEVNAKPQVIPSILQWKGGKGEFRLGNKVKIFTNATPEQKELLIADLKAICNCEVELVKYPRDAQICFILIFEFFIFIVTSFKLLQKHRCLKVSVFLHKNLFCL